MRDLSREQGTFGEVRHERKRHININDFLLVTARVWGWGGSPDRPGQTGWLGVKRLCAVCGFKEVK